MNTCSGEAHPRIRLLLLIALVLAFTPGQTSAEDDLSAHPIRFAVLGDRTGEHQPGVFGRIVTEVERLRPEFAITVGDMIEGYTTDSVTVESQWGEFLQLVEPLTMPIYYTPGNHDITFDSMEPAYERHVGPPYFSFDHRGLHVIVLDNSRWDVVEEFPKEQIDWLVEDLEENAGSEFTCVFLHIPYWYRTLADGKPDPLHEIFKSHGVDAVFSGHFHRYFSGEFDRIKYTTIGSSGGSTEESARGLLYHFAWVTVDDFGFHIAPVKMNAVLSWDEQSVSELRTIYRLENRALAFTAPAAVGEKLTIDDTAVTLKITNMTAEEYRDTLRWKAPEGWSVEPAVFPFTLSAYGTATANFTVASPGELYPLPEYQVRLPYAAGKTTTIDGRLEIARPLSCIRTKKAPRLDGELTDLVWRAPHHLLLDPEGNPSVLDSTAVYFAYDEDDLYLAAYCRDPNMDSLAAELTERDAAVYGEDCLGVMVCPSPGEGIGYQIYINPLGTVYDQKLEEQSDGYWTGSSVWDGEYEVKTKRGADYWTIEARFPLKQFGLEARAGDIWRVNFRRKQPRRGSFAIWQLPWSYDPGSFGLLVLE